MRGLGCGTCTGCNAQAPGTMGAIPVVITAAVKAELTKAAADWLAGILNAHPKDRGRLEANYNAFVSALGGDCDAVAFLRQRSGRYGVATVLGATRFDASATVPIGGWATQVARDDAYAKYQTAAPYCVGAPQPPVTNPVADEMPSFEELQAAVGRMMQNLPVGREALGWIAKGYITQAQVNAAVAAWGPRIYQAGGALDPAQGALISVPPMTTGTISPTMLLAVGGGALVLLLVLSGRSSRGR